MSRWLVAGLGRVGRVHVAALGRVPGAEVVGVVEASDAGRAEAAAVGLAVWDDLEEALVASRPDVLAVALPHHLHAWAAGVASAHGVPSLVEKPLARSVDEAVAMRLAAEAGGVHLGALLNYRAYRQLRWVRDLVADGTIPVQVAHVVADLPRPVDPPAWQTDGAGSGGGLLRTVGVHYVDLLTWWLGDPVDVVGTAEPAGCGDRAAAVLTFAGGAVATVTLASVAPSAAGVRTVLVGERGRVVVEGARLVSWPDGLEPPEPEDDGADLAFGAGHLAYLREADRAVARGEVFPVPATEGERSLRVVDAWYESAQVGPGGTGGRWHAGRPL